MATPRWLLGRHLTALSVIGMTEATTGTLGAVTTASLSGYVDSISIMSRPVMGMIQSVDRNQAHYEVELEDYLLVLAEILTVKAAHQPVLPSMSSAYDFYTVTFTRGSQTYVNKCRRGQFVDGVTNFGKNLAVLTLHPIDDSGNLVGPGFSGSAVVFTP